VYLSGKTSEFLEWGGRYGVMLSYRKTGQQDLALELGCKWMLDNGAFSGKFNERKWIQQMESLTPYKNNCLGAIAPDAVILDSNNNFVKGDWQKTLDRLHHYAPIIKSLGLPVAYALQDDHPLDCVPWDLFDCLFVAGTSEWKETSVLCEQICLEARSKGKWVHIGRVSSYKRMRLTWYADSWDGTTFKYGDKQEKNIRFSNAMEDNKKKYNQLRMI